MDKKWFGLLGKTAGKKFLMAVSSGGNYRCLENFKPKSRYSYSCFI